MSEQQQPQQPVTVSLEDAYREACLALGEAIVRERLFAKIQAPQQGPDRENVT